MRVMGRNGHPHAVDEARKRFKDHCAGTADVTADLRAPVYVTVLANGDKDTFEEMLKVSDVVCDNEVKHVRRESVGNCVGNWWAAGWDTCLVWGYFQLPTQKAWKLVGN